MSLQYCLLAQLLLQDTNFGLLGSTLDSLLNCSATYAAVKSRVGMNSWQSWHE